MPVVTGLSKPPTMTPFTASGGYDVGTPRDATRRPASESSRHIVGSRRSRLVTNASSYVPGTRRVKSKMPCFPGFAPVMNDDHAGNVTGEPAERRHLARLQELSRDVPGRAVEADDRDHAPPLRSSA